MWAMPYHNRHRHTRVRSANLDLPSGISNGREDGGHAPHSWTTVRADGMSRQMASWAASAAGSRRESRYTRPNGRSR
jgi:hypothetical protein